VQYITNSAQTQYTFAFYAPLNTDIQVFYQSSTATPIPATDILTLNVDYTVTFNADPITGGFITLLFTPTTGFYLTINRQVMASLNTNFSAAQNFNGANLDAALDRLLLLCQQNQNYALERNLSYIINTYLPNAVPFTQLPPLAQNFIWIGSGSGVVSAQIAMVPSASVLQSMLANNSPGTDGSRIVGYYDQANLFPTTVDQFLGYQVATSADSSVVANTITVTLESNYQFFTGNTLIARVGASNTGSTTIAVNGGTAITVKKYGSAGTYTPLVGGELTGGGLYTFTYDLQNNIWLLNSPNSGLNSYFYGSNAYSTTNQTVTTGTTVLVNYALIRYDTGVFKVGNSSMQPSRAGVYRVFASVVVSMGTPGTVSLDLYKNGVLYAAMNLQTTFAGGSLFGSDDLQLNGTTDYVQIFFANGSGANAALNLSSGDNNFQIEFLGS